ncbi:MAG: formate dehydrogenase accessory protein FdhE [Coriobacteriia bacterium]|nr:formate dehydrogenase accessory protein FdhE [Coriobacteriia bacterium]
MSNTARTKAIEHYISTRPDLEQQLRFFEALWDAQDDIAQGASPYEAASAEDTEKALLQTRTLFSLVGPTIPLEPYQAAVRQVAALMAEKAGLPDEQSAALAEVDIASAVSDESLASMLTGMDAFVTRIAGAVADDRLNEPLLMFVLTEAATPFLREPAAAAVKAAGKFDWQQWDSGLCPVCGTPASSGVVRDEGDLQGGRRWLSCPTCRTQWEFARVRCARCGQRTHDKLEYLYDEQDPGHRVHTCKECHGYIPVTFEKQVKVLAVPEVEEIVMIPLETVASERGLSPLGDEVEEHAN